MCDDDDHHGRHEVSPWNLDEEVTRSPVSGAARHTAAWVSFWLLATGLLAGILAVTHTAEYLWFMPPLILAVAMAVRPRRCR